MGLKHSITCAIKFNYIKMTRMRFWYYQKKFNSHIDYIPHLGFCVALRIMFMQMSYWNAFVNLAMFKVDTR